MEPSPRSPIATSGAVYVCYDRDDARDDRGGADLGIIDKAVNPRDCQDDEVELALNQKGPKGDPGTNGTNGVSGYEYVEKAYQHLSLPIEDAYEARCPVGKVPLGGGAIVQLYSPASFVRVGSAPLYSLPAVSRNSGSWFAWVKQDPVDGATIANITVRVTCATMAPSPSEAWPPAALVGAANRRRRTRRARMRGGFGCVRARRRPASTHR